jgi:hypothetical protein
MPEPAGTKQVPKRTDVKPQGLIRNTGQVDLYDRDPEYVYQSFSQDAKSPGHIDRFLRPHLYGEGQPWCQWIGPWEQVNATTDRAQSPLTSTAQGAPIDTRQRGPGDQLICRIHKSEYAKYQETDRVNSKERAKQLMRPDVRRGDLNSLTTVLTEGTVHPAEALSRAGHPMPAGMAIQQ